MAEKIISKVDRWGTLEEYRWRQRKGSLNLAEMEAHFRKYVPGVCRQLEEGFITQREAAMLIDTHCYNVFRGRRLEDIY